MKIILLVISLLIVPFAHAEWESANYTDPFTDVKRIGVKNDNIHVWCEPSNPKNWTKKHVLATIMTDGVPQISHNEVGVTGVLLKYRVDKSKHIEGRISVAEDYQGVLLCPGSARYCSKSFVKQIHKGDQLIYSVDTVSGGSEFREVDLTGGRELLKAVVDECK